MTQALGSAQTISPRPTEPALAPLAAHAAPAKGLAKCCDLMAMTKPRITAMVAFTAYVGFALGCEQGAGAGPSFAALAAVLGTALSCMSASVFNQVLEREVDARMRRTCNRPLPCGRLSILEAIWWGALLGVLGVSSLAVTAGALPAAIALITILTYVLVYTPLKPLTSVATIIGAVPGALPPVIGYAAAAGTLDFRAWLLFAILFLWQLPHFLAIAWLYRHDYARAGIAVLPVLDPSGESTFRQTLLGCLALLPLGMLPTMLGISGTLYLTGSLAAGLVFLGSAVALVLRPTERCARAMFTASLVYLPVVYTLMLMDPG